MLINNNSIHGIFKYSDNIRFEKDDFVVDGNCIYICTDPETPIGKRPSEDTEHQYYSEYPGNKIISASEYYDYVMSSERGLQVEDKYVSAHSLCEILENMYFGFGDNGILQDHIIYNPNSGIEYSVRGVNRILEYSTNNSLDMVLRDNDLNNGFIKISRNLPEIRDLLFDSGVSESDIVVLKQYTYLDSNNVIPYRVQELMDPEKNRIYFRFAKGIKLETGGNDFSDSIVSRWKSLFGDDSDVYEMLNSIEEYYQNRIEEEKSKIERIRGRYCYREVDRTETNYLGTGSVVISPGETRDVKSVESFTSGPCLLDVLVKIPISQGVYKNYSITLDAQDVATSNSSSEIYMLSDNISLTAQFSEVSNVQSLRLSVNVNSGVIKDIFYRDKTLDHIHHWVLHSVVENATCTEPGLENYVCDDPECRLGGEIITRPSAPLGHNLEHKSYNSPTCVSDGNYEYYHCIRCGKYFHDRECTDEFTGGDQVVIPHTGVDHTWGPWIYSQATCTSDGTRRRVCTQCGAEETEPIYSDGHNMAFVSLNPATCGKFGTIAHYHCTRCNKDFEDIDGNTELTEEDLKIYPTGHNINNSVHLSSDQLEIIEESTYSDDPNPKFGSAYYTCEHCGNKIVVPLGLRSHTFIDHLDIEQGDAWYDQNTERHYPSYTRGFDVADNQEKRNYNFITGISIEDQFNNHVISNHDRENYVPATCTQYGYWTGTCSLCGKPDARQYNWNDQPFGHEILPEDREELEHNTCLEPGHWIGTCNRCSGNHVEAVDPDHLVIGHRDEDYNHRCDLCDLPLN